MEKRYYVIDNETTLACVDVDSDGTIKNGMEFVDGSFVPLAPAEIVFKPNRQVSKEFADAWEEEFKNEKEE